MPEKNLTVRHIQKNDTLENWETKNPVLLQGEIGFATDENIMKVGNGSTHWNDLPEVGGKGSEEDNVTITKNASDKIQAIGTFNKNTASGATGALYDWVGTLQEWKDQNIATLHPDWVWYITDDVSGGASVYTKTEVDDKFIATNKITNCITHIPQDIKLELNDGTLTLKAGSKVYVPNGLDGNNDPQFDVITIANDLTQTGWGSATSQIMLITDGTDFYGNQPTYMYSGSTQPSVGTADCWWYDTANNVMKHTTNSGSTWTPTSCCLPIAVFTRTSGTIISIDQVFNGFGYIGSTIFALPNVKGLIPNGRNADGTLKSIGWTSTAVITRTFNDTQDTEIAFTGVEFQQNTDYHIKNDGYLYDNVDAKKYVTIIGRCKRVSGVISNFRTKTAFHALDYNDSEYMAHQAMPSDRYVDLTLGASGSTYTAPADGYVYIFKVANANNQYAQIASDNLGIISIAQNTNWTRAYLPVKKGDKYGVDYTAGGQTRLFRFIYAEGAQ